MPLPSGGADPDYPRPKPQKPVHGLYDCANCGGCFPLVWNNADPEATLEVLKLNPTILVVSEFGQCKGLMIRCPHCKEREYIPEEIEPMPQAEAPKNPSTLPLKTQVKIVYENGETASSTSNIYELGDTCEISWKRVKRPWWMFWYRPKFSQRAIVEIVREEDVPPTSDPRDDLPCGSAYIPRV